MKTRSTRRALALVCVLLITGALGLAQAGRGVGRLAGTVKDEAGNPVAGAMVVMEYEKGGRREGTTTDGKGEWAFLGTGTGRAKLTFGAEGRQSVILFVMVRQLQANKPVHVVLRPMEAPPQADDPAPKAERSGPVEVVTRTYALRHVDPQLVKESLHVYFYNISFGEGSGLISVRLPKANVAAFEAELSKLDVPKRNILLRVFTVIASREGQSEAIANRDLKKVLAEVSNLLNFSSYAVDGASVITLKDGTRYAELLLSSETLENLRLELSRVTLGVGADNKRAVRLRLHLEQKGGLGSLLRTDTEVAQNGYLVAGVSRIGGGGRSLVLVINAEIE
ncbi:MAG: carboxypeptidase regulatory-like domain-containing protein [Candidatus Aminicenantes bacterium]|nr:carboxypeptidase regulatory-like domain-containing protein [Candidatus Aminicenantes bacterium]